jgi:hypothetical protein
VVPSSIQGKPTTGFSLKIDSRRRLVHPVFQVTLDQPISICLKNTEFWDVALNMDILMGLAVSTAFTWVPLVTLSDYIILIIGLCILLRVYQLNIGITPVRNKVFFGVRFYCALLTQHVSAPFGGHLQVVRKQKISKVVTIFNTTDRQRLQHTHQNLHTTDWAKEPIINT